MAYKRLPQSDFDYIRTHLDQSALCIASTLGISIGAAYRALHRFGSAHIRPKQSHDRSYDTDVIRLYPDTPNPEICRLLGISFYCVISVRNRYHLHKTEDCKRRIMHATGLATGTRNLGIAHEKFRHKQTVNNWCMISGIPLKYPEVSGDYLASKNKKDAMRRLVRYYNYYWIEGSNGHHDYFQIGYDSQTSRTPMEHLYENRYHLTFINGDNE